MDLASALVELCLVGALVSWASTALLNRKAGAVSWIVKVAIVAPVFPVILILMILAVKYLFGGGSLADTLHSTFPITASDQRVLLSVFLIGIVFALISAIRFEKRASASANKQIETFE
ncbi:MAG: hypothetical protein ABJ242_08625 [Marinomonas sp.]